jgi:signal transduction histidine kinase
MHFIKIFIVFVGFIIQITVYSAPVDSVLSRLKALPEAKQLDSIIHLSFNFIVENNQLLIPVFHKYEQVAVQQKRPGVLAHIYTNLSLAYYYNGKYDKNLEYGLKAIKLYDSLGDKSGQGTMYGELGYQMKRRNLPGAFKLMQHGILVLEGVGEVEPLAKIYDNYGVLHEMNNNFDSAMFFYRKALSIKEKLADSTGIPYSLNNIFGLFLFKSSYDSAKYYLDQSTLIRKKRNDIIGLAENYSYFGQLYVSMGNFSKAIESENIALQIAQKHNYIFLAQNLYRELSTNYERLGNYRQALDFYKLYKQFQDSLVNLETNKTMANLEIRYETAEKEKELVIKKQQLIREKDITVVIIVIALILVISALVFFWSRMQISRRNEKIKVRNALIEGEQTERNRLALELHDGIANDLNAAILSLSNTSVTNLGKSVDILRKTHQSVRKMSHVLMSRSLKEKGLVAALNELSGSFETDDLRIKVQVFGLEERPDLFIELNIYRIVQESLNNIVKHAQAHNVLIECNHIDELLFVNIEDDGIGFPKDFIEGKGIGLQNITNRVTMMNGTMNIRTAPNEGTAIEIQLPIN